MVHCRGADNLGTGARLLSGLTPDRTEGAARKASFEGAEFYTADLYYALLNGANLRSAILPAVNLHGADLSSADLQGADLTGTNLANGQLRGAIYDLATTWPKDLHPYRTGAQLAATDDEE
jgi:uncharacterized protein YjbI with pentapeptide repeats